ncbi:prepilin-type N-terminal cleavage/methylation domain-containing protein [Ferrimonas sediminicola]|uniref:prepilin-type N-terminal cleavage/methylation domain-containing protein n=1 Tax=Ferrimonas sediminicola TaxID=2569538 RepID=UPI00145EBEDF|nr:prepilin-type N-terminal cleavage/methylation domain-containing protein [Ferrimonas sediminicola]
MSQRGFTLTELTVVIILLALLALAVASRLIAISDDTHQAQARGLFGAFSSAVGQFHGLCMARGGDIQGQGDLGVGGGLDFPDLGLRSSTLGSCYPEAGLGDGRISDFDDCLQTLEGLLSPLPEHNTSAVNHSDADYQAASDAMTLVIHYADVHRCELYYVASGQGVASPRLSYNGLTGDVTTRF